MLNICSEHILIGVNVENSKPWFSSCAHWYLPKGDGSVCPYETLHVGVYSSFIHNCKNQEATKMFFSKWLRKVCFIQTMECYLALKRNDLWFPWWSSDKESTCQCREHRFNSYFGKIPHSAGQLSPCPEAHVPQLLKPCMLQSLYSATREAITTRSPHTPPGV